jgi:hypothetical protein
MSPRYQPRYKKYSTHKACNLQAFFIGFVKKYDVCNFPQPVRHTKNIKFGMFLQKFICLFSIIYKIIHFFYIFSRRKIELVDFYLSKGGQDDQNRRISKNRFAGFFSLFK